MNFRQHLLNLFLIALSLGVVDQIQAQETFPRNDVADERADRYAITNATIVVSPTSTLEGATLLVNKDRIEDIGTAVAVPDGYTVIDASGKHIYPSFIDLHTHYGLPEPEKRSRGGGFNGREQIEPNTRGAFSSNDAIKAHYRAGDHYAIDDKKADDYRKGGFGVVLSFRDDGIARGTSALVALGNSSANKTLLQADAAAHYSFSKGTSTQYYPRSMMGYISLLRQTYLDATWYDDQDEKPYEDQALSAWIQTQDLPQFFDAGNWMNSLRADKVGDEFGVQYTIVGGNDMYQRIDQVVATGAEFIVPLNFPEAYDVEDPWDAERVTLSDMLHWELAPTNPGALDDAGVTFALTRHGLKSNKDFMRNLRSAIEHGLTAETALAALTTVPAKMVGMEGQLGTLEKGKLANFIIADGELFEDEGKIQQNWVLGKQHVYQELELRDLSGDYQLKISDQVFDLKVSGEPGKQKAKIHLNDSIKLDVMTNFDEDLVTLTFAPTKKSIERIRLSGWTTGDTWAGRGQLTDGSWVDWSAERTGDAAQESKDNTEEDKDDDEEDELGDVIYPFVAFGQKELPKAERLIIKNATVWTNESEGILTDTDVLLEGGKIIEIGNNLRSGGAREIDGTGKHLTAGIIDEHTHIGGGGNDVATNSGMVRIGDQLNSEQINLYRALAGGVTAAQVLHGSANPIGGQSALIKLRWGAAPEDMKIDGADEFIKFALGENVKRSRNSSSIRYPQTRMGVEQVYVDAFSQAQEYEKKWQSFEAGTGPKPRRDLAKEAMLEIVNGERFITCHSYVQSEINMLMHVADRFGFTINTFTHILEGYKVADKMAKHGAGGSSFSDWWNYKWEVRYAIPYNPTLMQDAGVLVAINSDDANMGRRLNQEAAKSIKYGGMDEESALKMVTLNPAKLLHLDDRMGSVKVGKDADVVLWTDHPLSIYARADKTIVDGIVYFDIEEDKNRREEVRAERNRLVQKMIGAKKSGAPTSKRSSSLEMEIHCESVLGVHSHGHH